MRQAGDPGRCRRRLARAGPRGWESCLTILCWTRTTLCSIQFISTKNRPGGRVAAASAAGAGAAAAASSAGAGAAAPAENLRSWTQQLSWRSSEFGIGGFGARKWPSRVVETPKRCVDCRRRTSVLSRWFSKPSCRSHWKSYPIQQELLKAVSTTLQRQFSRCKYVPSVCVFHFPGSRYTAIL